MPISQNLCYNCFAEGQGGGGACPLCGYDNRENAARYPVALKAGSILNGQYIVGRVLGQGGFGITYLALDYQLKIKVAIKEYIPDGMATRLPETTLVSVYAGEKQDNFNYGAERFLDEARVLAKFIGNKNIAGVKSYFSENNTAYFVMDYIEGISFKNYIRNKGGRVDYTDALRVLMPVMDALAAVHREGFIHRDVTPDNIYITKDDEIKLLDFGSARYSLGDKSKSLDVILKAGYAPKEQYIRRGKQGAYTDIYSLAACFYASITGYLPPEALERMEEDEIVPISTRGIKIPDNLENAIMKGLEVRAEDRWQSVEEFKATIEGAVISYGVPTIANASPVTTGASPTATGTPPVITSTGTGESISAWQATGQQLSGQYGQPLQYTEGQPVAAEQRNMQTNLPQTPWEQAPDPIENKAVPFLKKNKAAAIISAVACLILVISIIGMIGNNSGNGGSVAPAGNIEGASDEDGYVADLQSDSTLELPIIIEPIDIIMDYWWVGESVYDERVAESVFTEISNILSIPLKVNIIQNEEVLSITEMHVAADERSMFFSDYYESDIINLEALGATVIQPNNYAEYFIITPCIEYDVAVQIISEFEKITASTHVNGKEYSASAGRPDGIYTGDILNGNRDGYGFMWYYDDSWYFGAWKDNLYNGYGYWNSPSGSLYEGEFVNDMPTGNGTLTSVEGDQYFDEIIGGGYSSQAAETEAADKAAADKAANMGEFSITFNGKTHKYITEDSLYFSSITSCYDIFFWDTYDSNNSIQLDLPANVSAGNSYKSNDQISLLRDLVTLYYDDKIYFLIEDAYYSKEVQLSATGYYVNYSTIYISEWGGSGGTCKGTFEAQIELATGDIIDFTGSFNCKIPGNGFD